MGFADADSATLLTVRGNLLRGMDKLAAHVEAGTLHEVPEGRNTPPAASGWLMVILLDGIEAELAARAGTAVAPGR